jgi:hypothetical protein
MATRLFPILAVIGGRGSAHELRLRRGYSLGGTGEQSPKETVAFGYRGPPAEKFPCAGA